MITMVSQSDVYIHDNKCNTISYSIPAIFDVTAYEGVEYINYTKIGIKQMRIYMLSRDVVGGRYEGIPVDVGSGLWGLGVIVERPGERWENGWIEAVGYRKLTAATTASAIIIIIVGIM